MIERYVLGVMILALLGTIGWREFSHSQEVGKLQRELSASRQETIAAGQRIVAMQAAQNIITANRDDLQRQVQRQNTAMDVLRERAMTAEAKAGRRASDVLLAAERERERVEAIPGSGPEAMNDKLREVFR